MTEDIKNLVAAFKELAKVITEAVEKFVSIFEETTERINKKESRLFNYHVPYRQTIRHQVLNRKPRMIVARSCC